MIPDFSTYIDKWENLVRSGQGDLVKTEIEKLKPHDVHERYYGALCNLARRVGAYGFAFSFFKNYYFENESKGFEEDFLGEYAALVSEVGASSVGTKLFNKITNPSLAKTYYLKGLYYMRSWQYKDAENQWDEFLKHEKQDYWIQIGQLNFAACLIHNKKFSHAEDILKQLEQSKSQLSQMSLGILNELWGEYYFFNNDHSKALECFTKSKDVLNDSNSPTYFYAQKWVHIIELMNGNVDSSWQQFRQQSLEYGYWEIVRELDKYWALKQKNENLIKRLYFGTPFNEYKENLIQFFNWQPPSEYNTAPEQEISFDRKSLTFFSQDNEVSSTPLFQNLLYHLSLDLYRPTSSAYLFDCIYKDQYYSPEFANQRVYSLMTRFRKFCEENSINIDVSASHLGFSVNTTESSLLYSTGETQLPKTDDHGLIIEEIKARYMNNEEFISRDIVEIFSVSPRTANRILSKGVEAGDFIKMGQSKSTKFKVK